MRLRAPLLLLALVAPALALGADHDPAVKAQLEAKGTPYEIDDDGDFEILVTLGDGRSQLVWVRSPVETTEHHRVREIWSPGYRSETGEFSASVANDLLDRNNALKLGAWVKQDDVAMFVIKIPAEANASQLDEAIDLAAATADSAERALTGGDEF